jgi:hypothetical protein
MELKPCPFCGVVPELLNGVTSRHPLSDCILSQFTCDDDLWNRRSAPVAEAGRFDIAKLPEQIVDDMVEILGWDMSSEEVAMAIGVVLKRLNANAALTSAEKPEEEKEVLNRAYKFIDLLLGNKEFLYRMTAEKVLRDLLEIITQHRIARKEG